MDGRRKLIENGEGSELQRRLGGTKTFSVSSKSAGSGNIVSFGFQNFVKESVIFFFGVDTINCFQERVYVVRSNYAIAQISFLLLRPKTRFDICK